MRVYNYARAAGKTTMIVKHAIDHNLEIMVFGSHEKRRLLEIFTDLKPDQVFTVDEAKSRKGRRYAGTVIDNLDLILQQLVDNRISAVSLTEPMVMMQHSRESK